MTKESIKIFIPMAGFGTRLRPHTWSRPKQLVSIADQTVLDHVLSMFETLPDKWHKEFVFIIGYLGDQIKNHMQQAHPDLDVKFVTQEEMRGQSHALYLAKEYFSGPMLMVFADTIIESDLKFLDNESADAVAWVKKVPDPRRFGVAVVNDEGWVARLIEKPQSLDNNLAVVGCYFLREAETLLGSIEEQIRREQQIKGEYYLADALNLALGEGMRMRTHEVSVWLDAGTPEDVLSTNRYMLENGHDNSADIAARDKVVVNPPVFVHPQANLENVILGPYVSIAADCDVKDSLLRNTILEQGSSIYDATLADSIIGQQASIHGKVNRLNAGDHTLINL